MKKWIAGIVVMAVMAAGAYVLIGRNRPQPAAVAAIIEPAVKAPSDVVADGRVVPVLDAALSFAGARPETVAAAEADVAAAQAGLDQALAALAETQLPAPFDGVVVTLDLRSGEQVSPGATVIQLADLSGWRIETSDLTELSVVGIREGDPVRMTFDAIPGLVMPGTVQRIKGFGESKQGDITYTVIIHPDQMDARLRWNMTASVTISTK